MGEKEFPRKVLVSPGFGAGWSSWSYGSKEGAQFLAEYQPIIEFLEMLEDVQQQEVIDACPDCGVPMQFIAMALKCPKCWRVM